MFWSSHAQITKVKCASTVLVKIFAIKQRAQSEGRSQMVNTIFI